MLSVDGAFGEGGGQILRSSLALSLCTGKPFRMFNIRKARKRPGLMRQHLAAVLAAARVSGAKVEGAELDSREIVFSPGPVEAGDYRFAIGTAGSTALVLQTILPALMTARGTSHLVLEGGTHNPFAPPYEFLAWCFLPLLNRMGPHVELRLERPGFYPAGGGVMQVRIDPAARLRPLRLVERGDLLETRVEATVANLPEHIARRELDVVADTLGIPGDHLHIRHYDMARGPGNVLTVFIKSGALTEVFTGFGERGVAAEIIAERVARDVRRYLRAGVPVGDHLADQLLLPLVLAGEGEYVTLRPSLHTETNIHVIEYFTAVNIGATEISDDVWRIGIGA